MAAHTQVLHELHPQVNRLSNWAMEAYFVELPSPLDKLLSDRLDQWSESCRSAGQGNASAEGSPAMFFAEVLLPQLLQHITGFLLRHSGEPNQGLPPGLNMQGLQPFIERVTAVQNSGNRTGFASFLHYLSVERKHPYVTQAQRNLGWRPPSGSPSGDSPHRMLFKIQGHLKDLADVWAPVYRYMSEVMVLDAGISQAPQAGPSIAARQVTRVAREAGRGRGKGGNYTGDGGFSGLGGDFFSWWPFLTPFFVDWWL
jgi:hypothetical protein